MALNFAANKIFGYDPENSPGNLGEMFCKYRNALLSLPLNIPGTAFHECMKVKNNFSPTIRQFLSSQIFSLAAKQQKENGNISLLSGSSISH